MPELAGKWFTKTFDAVPLEDSHASTSTDGTAGGKCYCIGKQDGEMVMCVAVSYVVESVPPFMPEVGARAMSGVGYYGRVGSKLTRRDFSIAHVPTFQFQCTSHVLSQSPAAPCGSTNLEYSSRLLRFCLRW